MKKRAIVMGATSGIGMEVAKLLADKGWLIGIAGRRVDRLETVMKEVNHRYEASNGNANTIGRIVCYKQIDVTSPNAPILLRELITELGGMDLYFHSSGIGWQNNLLDIDKELKTMETNGLGFVRMVDTAFNWFAEQSDISVTKEASARNSYAANSSEKNPSQKKFRIACITSIAGTKGLGAAPSYSATKRFQNHYIECLSQQATMRHLPIAFTDIRPGFVKTDLIAGSHYPLQLHAQDVARNIVKAIEADKEVKVIDWRYAILVFFWRLIPRWIWKRMRIC